MTISNKYSTDPIVKKQPDLKETLEQFFQLVAPSWPLATAVACNPLQGLESKHFAEATKLGSQFFDANGLPGLWQFRWAKNNGYLHTANFQEALNAALRQTDAHLFLGQERISMRMLAEQLIEQFDDRERPKTAGPLFQKALSFLTEKAPWKDQLEVINRHCITWLGAFMDEGQAAWSMPGREQGLFAAVKSLLIHDRKLLPHRSFLKDLPDDSLPALRFLLDCFPHSENQQEAFLRDQLLALPGWASFIRWRSEQADYEPQLAHPVSLTDYLALRLLLAVLYVDPKKQPEPYMPSELQQLSVWLEDFLNPSPDTDPEQWAELVKRLEDFHHQFRLELLQAWEEDFRTRLSRELLTQVDQQALQERPDAQFAFCIDVRSEPFRRQLEAQGNYETFGFAGFFGLPIAYKTILGKRVKSLPVLLQPAHELVEQGGQGCNHQVEQVRLGRQLINELKLAYKSLKYNIATPFAAVEALGLPAALISVARSLMPRTLIGLRRRGRRLFHPDIDLAPDITPSREWGIPMEQQITYAGNALKMMGMTSNFAPLIVLCGHGSQTENNPYAAALDCGACGGSHGGPNAIAMARILNQTVVRKRLRQEGIDIPEDTLFIGAEHNTTTDEVCLLALPKLTKKKQEQIAALQADLKKAQAGNLGVRAPQFGQKDARTMLRKSTDWAEVRPEWGLAGNAGFVVAPRHLTAKLNLKGRCFLHSYDWTQDSEGTSLEVILTAPLVVAQWINSQYFFSTVDNTAFGSGSKITHNVVGKVGILQGNGSDLMHGLPWQSVMADDDNLYHQPLRLTAMVVAPRSRVATLVDKHAILQQMFFNEWVTLQVFDPEEKQLWKLESSGEWKKED